MANWSQEAVERLALAVSTRRANLERAQLEVWRRGGPSNSTMTSIENAASRTITRRTQKKLDMGLDWVPGTASGVLTGQIDPHAASARDTKYDMTYQNELVRQSGSDLAFNGTAADITAGEIRVPAATAAGKAWPPTVTEREATDGDFPHDTDEQARLAASARRLATHLRLVDLVESARALAATAADTRDPLTSDIQSLVRQIENAVADVTGKEFLWDELLFRAEQKLSVVAQKHGVLEEFLEEAVTARESDTPREEFLGRAAAKLNVDVVWTPAGVRLKLLAQPKSSDDSEALAGLEGWRADADRVIEVEHSNDRGKESG